MVDENNRNEEIQPTNEHEQAETPSTPETGLTDTPANETAPPEKAASEGDPAATEQDEESAMHRRLERLGGEPAPAISPEEFARLQQAGQIHIDARGRVRTTRREETDAGMSLRKRRAWYTRR
ncbi:MAG: hypothetical protein Kow0077_13390 [Anaerolineae bacterium]